MVLQRWMFPLFLTAIVAGQVPHPADPRDLEKHASDLIDQALNDKNPNTRAQATMALSLGGPREPFLSKLETMLSDRDVEVRLAAVSSLADLKTARGRVALRKALNDDTPEVGFAAAKALYILNDPKGKEAMLAVLSGETRVASGFVTKEKREAMRMMHMPRTLLWFALKQGIGFAPVPGLGEGISSMQGILSDPGVSGRAMAALLLGKERDPATLAALREALEDKDASVRAAAVQSLALRNDAAMLKDLTPLIDDKNEAVRLRAAAAYLRLEMIRKTAQKKSTEIGKIGPTQLLASFRQIDLCSRWLVPVMLIGSICTKGESPQRVSVERPMIG